MVGRTVHHYQLFEKLGGGGMGDIYKAQDTRLNRVVAIKVLTSAATGDPDRRRRFIQEAQAASALNHPNIITIHDIISEGDTEFMVMEYVAGKTLVDLIPKGGLRTPQVLKYSVQMSDALQAAHTAGIVHRDLKPGNVMVTDSGLVKVLDFGLAKLTDRGPISTVSGPDDETKTIASTPLTVEGSILGTVSYMSPEQAQGKKVDTRSDIFSFGVVLYEMVTGMRAFVGESALSTLSAILRDEVRPIAEVSPDVPPQLELVIGRCLKKLPDERWQTMKDVQMALAALKHESDSGMLYRARMSEMHAPAAPAVAAAPVSATPPLVQPGGQPSVQAAAASGAPQGGKKLAVPVLASMIGGVLFLAAVVGGGVWWAKHRKRAEPAPVAVVAPPAEPAPAPAPTPEPAADAAAQTAATPAADATLTNDNIIEMVQAKVSANVIMSQIRASKTNFTLTPAELIRLTKAGVTENVIEQMRNPKHAVAVAPAAGPGPVVKGQPTPQISPQPAPQPGAPQPTTQNPPPQPVPQETTQAPVAQPAPKAGTATVTLKDGTPFTIVLSEAVPDKTEEGHPLRFTAAQDLKVGDAVVIAKGAAVTGAIVDLPGKKILGIGGGKMTLKLIQADAVDGHKINVRALQSRRAEGTVRPVEPQGRAKIKDITAPAGTEYLAYIDGDQTVATRQ